MTATKPVGLGLIGTGAWARGFWESAAGCPDVRLIACHDARPEAASDFAATFGCEPAPSMDALLAHPQVEAVAVFTSNRLHRAPAEAAAAAGKHVFCEKPIANTIEDAAAMIRTCQAAGVTLMVGHSARYSPASRALKAALDSGRLGQPIMVEGNNSHSGGARLSDREWRWRRDEAPGGPLIQLAIHTFDTLHYLFGPTRRATALSNASLLPSEIEDVFLCLLEFESGLLAYVGTNYASPAVSYLRLYGRRANALASGHHLTLTLADDRDPWHTTTEESDLPHFSPHAAEMSEFARALRSGSPPETGPREGLLALGLVHACLLSAEQNRPVLVREALRDAASLLD